MLLFAPLLLSAHLVLAADHPPKLDVEPSCQAAAAKGVNGRSQDACMNEETTAQNTLSGRWKDFTARQQARCTDLVHMGGPPSYVELLTCLEMAEQARKIPDRDLLHGTAGMGTFAD